jgi:hypothetical protein
MVHVSIKHNLKLMSWGHTIFPDTILLNPSLLQCDLTTSQNHLLELCMQYLVAYQK